MKRGLFGIVLAVCSLLISMEAFAAPLSCGRMIQWESGPDYESIAVFDCHKNKLKSLTMRRAEENIFFEFRNAYDALVTFREFEMKDNEEVTIFIKASLGPFLRSN